MSWALPRMVGDVVRLCPVAKRAGAIVTVSLWPVPGVRAGVFAGPSYGVGVAVSWWPELGVLRLCDAHGDAVEWSLVDIAAWLQDVLGGWPVILAIESGIGAVGAAYTGRRAQRQAGYMAALDASAFRADALALRARWAHQRETAARRSLADGRAAALDGVADVLDAISTAEAQAGATA